MEAFYVIQLTSWTGDGIKPVIGPTSREEAEAQESNYSYIPGGGDICIMRCGHARVVSRDWLARHGFPRSLRGETRLVEYLELAKESPPSQLGGELWQTRF